MNPTRRQDQLRERLAEALNQLLFRWRPIPGAPRSSPTLRTSPAETTGASVLPRRSIRCFSVGGRSLVRQGVRDACVRPPPTGGSGSPSLRSCAGKPAPSAVIPFRPAPMAHLFSQVGHKALHDEVSVGSKPTLTRPGGWGIAGRGAKETHNARSDNRDRADGGVGGGWAGRA